MKLFSRISLTVALAGAFALLSFCPSSSKAQLPGGDKNAGGMNAAMVKLFGSNTNFVCRSEAHVYDKAGHETTTMPMNFEMLGARIRVGINMGDVKSKELSTEFITTMKQMGMDQVITILLPDRKIVRSIYPGLKSYSDTPMDKEEAASALKTYKITKSKLGRETIDGHSAEKDLVTMTDETGAKQQATVWYAGDLHDFPVQIEIAEDTSTLLLRFKDIKLGRPELSHFEAPSGYAKYDNVNAMMSDAITKKMGNTPRK